MKILAFTGMPCSGKTEAVNYAKEKNIPVIRMGDAVWEETKSQGFELNDKNVGSVANNMRNIHGKDIWAKRTIAKIKNLDDNKILVIDGIRNMEEIDAFKKELGNNFILIAIEASTETRRRRALGRSRTDDSKDIKDLEQRDKRELGWGLGVVIANADIVISNEGSIFEFKKEIKKLLSKI
jgi:dephospho-CoA kinase